MLSLWKSSILSLKIKSYPELSQNKAKSLEFMLNYEVISSINFYLISCDGISVILNKIFGNDIGAISSTWGI